MRDESERPVSKKTIILILTRVLTLQGAPNYWSLWKQLILFPSNANVS